MLEYKVVNIKLTDAELPILNLILKGKKPSKSCKIKVNDLREIICKKFPLVEVKLYQKFTQYLTTLDKYINL